MYFKHKSKAYHDSTTTQLNYITWNFADFYQTLSNPRLVKAMVAKSERSLRNRRPALELALPPRRTAKERSLMKRESYEGEVSTGSDRIRTRSSRHKADIVTYPELETLPPLNRCDDIKNFVSTVKNVRHHNLSSLF